MKKLLSILRMTCPRCHQGKMFDSSIDFRHPLKMHKQCVVCRQRFEPEPGFYYGAMFISYIFIGIFSLIVVGASVFYFKLSVEVSFLILFGLLAIMFFWNLRFSRSLWIHLVVRYDPLWELKWPDDQTD